jgi:hypothetical protein
MKTVVPEFDVKTSHIYMKMKEQVLRNSHSRQWLQDMERKFHLPIDIFWDLCGDAGTATEHIILEILKEMPCNGIRFEKALREKNKSEYTATYDISCLFQDNNDLIHFQKLYNLEGECEIEWNANTFMTRFEVKSSKLKDRNGTRNSCLDFKGIFLHQFTFFIIAFRAKGVIYVYITHKNVFEKKPNLLTGNGKNGSRLRLTSAYSLNEFEKAEKDILKQLAVISTPWFNITF